MRASGSADEAAAVDAAGGDDQVLAAQQAERLADGGAAQARLLAQLRLRRESGTRQELAGHDLDAEPVGEDLVSGCDRHDKRAYATPANCGTSNAAVSYI